MVTLEQVTVSVARIACGGCGGVYAISEKYRKQKEQEGGGWHCPYCQCSWGYWDGENEKLKKQVQEANDRLAGERARHDQTREALAHEKHGARSVRGHLSRVKKRVAAGVCPCCNRTFQNLARHMVGQHPSFIEKNPA
jgi:hypothetical protein